MKHEYLPKDREGRLFRLIEELGEVSQALGKAGRFGMANRDPRTGALNVTEILRELEDLRHAIDAVEPDLRDEERLALDRLP